MAKLPYSGLPLKRLLAAQNQGRTNRTARASAGDMGQARRLFQDLLARQPEHPQAMIGYADLCVTLGDLSTARVYYRKALELGTVSALALGGLATFEKFSKDSPEAAQILR